MGKCRENVQRQKKIETVMEKVHKTQLRITLHLMVTWVLGLSKEVSYVFFIFNAIGFFVVINLMEETQ